MTAEIAGTPAATVATPGSTDEVAEVVRDAAGGGSHWWCAGPAPGRTGRCRRSDST
ncbi:hypothetical protein [Dactylosporangium cerinum]